MPAGPTVQMAVAALHGEGSAHFQPQGYALLTVDPGGASLAVWLNAPGAPAGPRLALLTPIGPVEAEPALSGVPGLFLFLLDPMAGSVSSGLWLDFPGSALHFRGDWVWLTELHADRPDPEPQAPPEPLAGLGTQDPEPLAEASMQDPELTLQHDPEPVLQQEPEPEAMADLDGEAEIPVRPLALEAPPSTPVTTPIVTPEPVSPREVTLRPVPYLPCQPAGKAQVNPEKGSLSLTLRGLPTPARFGTAAATGRPYAHYHAWLLKGRGRSPCPVGPCRHGWGGNYGLEVPAGLPLREYDHLVITAGDSADGPSLLTGDLPWAR